MVNRSKSEWLSGREDSCPPLFVNCTAADYKRAGAIKVLGAFIGDMQACHDALLTTLSELDTCCRRLTRMAPDEALEILKSVVFKGTFIVRTHQPSISLDFAKAFDSRIVSVWRNILGMRVLMVLRFL